MSTTIPIHTSDRKKFKGCRREWDFSSVIRQAYRPARVARPLGFGTSIHKGLETLYTPDTWNMVKNGGAPAAAVYTASLQAFRDQQLWSKQVYLKQTGQEFLPEQFQVEYDEDMKLGDGMLRNYFKWHRREDQFIPVAVELDFEVPLCYPSGPQIYIRKNGEWLGVVYRGRIDVLVRDLDGGFWIMDHKTNARWDDRFGFLELDEQCGSYCWALQVMLGIKIEGVIYSELYKGAPEPPERLTRPYKGRNFSTNKQQNTTYDLFIQTLKDANEPFGPYADYINFLKAEGKTYFRREQIHRSQIELKNLGLQIAEEAQDMLDKPRIYPNPGKYTCDWCAYRQPCIATNDGSDVQFILNTNYIKVKGHYGANERPSTS
jgi:hypothetical protein